jgi:membrane-associated phospholipid phosphatase
VHRFPRTAASLAGFALAASTCAGPAVASDHDWQVAADVGEIGLVSLALGKTAVEGDWAGARQLGYGLAVTGGATYALKHAFPETRPNGRDDKSFPSGHTSLSFAAAGYLQQRYGWRIGLPATVAAGLVGVSRVQSHDHHWYDVVAGAALGEVTAVLLTTPHDGGVRVLPWADSKGAGFALYTQF